MELTIVLLVVILFDIVALRWGVDSREKIDSPEWERRKHFLSSDKSREESLSGSFGMIYIQRHSRRLSPCLSNCEKSY